MKLTFPSREFDEAVAAVCHGTASDEQAPALNELLRSDAAARDEYIARAELHSRLASEPDLFTDANKNQMTSLEDILPVQLPRSAQTRTRNSALHSLPALRCSQLDGGRCDSCNRAIAKGRRAKPSRC